MSFFTISLIILFGLITVLNMVFAFAWSTALWLFISFAIVMLPSAVFLFVGRPIFKKFFNADAKVFRVNKFEEFICKITNVKSWKDKIPVGAKVAGAKMDKLADPKSVEYLDGYIFESCFAEYLHLTIFFWCFVCLLIFGFVFSSFVFLRMILPIALVFAYQNIVSVIIQWYMRPRIVKYRDMLKKREERSQNAKQKTEE